MQQNTRANRVYPDAETQLEIYRRMIRIERNDDAIRRAIRLGRLQMPYYSARGQEVIPSAVSTNLNADDTICTIYRGIHDMVAKGVPLRPLWAEIAGRVTGTCKGKGGPMHITHPESGVMVTTGIVGSSMPIANGLAWAAKLDRSRRVCIAYFGDGASNIGAFHESLNLASIWKLPVVFVCQNNRFAEHTRYEKCTAVDRVAKRAISYDMPGETVDGNDPFEMYAATRDAIDRARDGGGPTLIEAVTFRFLGHVFGDDDKYMDKTEKAAAIARDPLPAFRTRLLESHVATEQMLDAMQADITAEIEDAMAFALASEFPSVEELRLDIFQMEIVE
jgi:TPP-dependent pyruvate/acetoin dehydrogenase alpha subunit